MLPKWAGVFCALWTPTDKNGRLLDHSLRTNLAFIQRHGVTGLLPLGSTGEFLHLDLATRRQLLEEVAAVFDPAQIIVNISDIRPAAVAELARFAKATGFGAVSLLPPYFFAVNQDDLCEFFVRSAAAADLPLFLYNFPERTGNRISLETIAAVADRVPVAGVKQSGAEFEYHATLVELAKRRQFVVLTGADTRLPDAVRLGVNGCVSGLANAVPDLVAASFLSACQGTAPASDLASQRMAELGRRIQKVQFPLQVAAAMEARGLEVGPSKSVVSNATQRTYQQLVQELSELFREWKLI